MSSKQQYDYVALLFVVRSYVHSFVLSVCHFVLHELTHDTRSTNVLAIFILKHTNTKPAKSISLHTSTPSPQCVHICLLQRETFSSDPFSFQINLGYFFFGFLRCVILWLLLLEKLTSFRRFDRFLSDIFI